MAAQPQIRGLVLAAGAGSRFGGDKLHARFGGRTILQHVLATGEIVGLFDQIVVVPPGSGEVGGATAAVNPDPGRGLSSSLRVGWAAATAPGAREVQAVLVGLGDQPRVRKDVLRALMNAPLDADRPVVAPRYAGSAARNPVRIELGAIADDLVARATGDRGLGPLLDARPELVRWIDVEGDNPDIDRPADLVALAEADWADRVRENREQVDRFREVGDEDHYAPVAGFFRDDPRRSGDDILDALLAIARPGDTWLDVGAGGGRYAFPLALAVRRVIALDPSPAMLSNLEDGARDEGLSNLRVVAGRWPEAIANLAPVPCADVTLIANVGHDTEAIGPFVDALERATRRECVAVMQERPPAAIAAPFFLAVHGERRIPLPALPDVVDLLVARGTHPEVTTFERGSRGWRSRDDLLTLLRRQTWVRPGSDKDRRLVAELDRLATVDATGALTLPGNGPSRVGLVRWSPRSP
jgi:CTP:molybdopterin cytidylyltransferase MocA/SAM-dependent methyltransferase